MKEVAAQMGVSTRTVQRWQDEGVISFFKQGKVVRISDENLQRWIEKKTIKEKKKTA
jgi:excisionase family DNA binding protein